MNTISYTRLFTRPQSQSQKRSNSEASGRRNKHIALPPAVAGPLGCTLRSLNFDVAEGGRRPKQDRQPIYESQGKGLKDGGGPALPSFGRLSISRLEDYTKVCWCQESSATQVELVFSSFPKHLVEGSNQLLSFQPVRRREKK
jgi:hypothetical protein